MRNLIPVPIAVSLSAVERRTLRCLAGCMIPASAEYAVPGADDDTIFADIIKSLGSDAPQVGEALRHLDALSNGGFAALGKAERQALAQTFRNQHTALAAVLVRVVAQCYYRDDRVMRSLDMEPRPPYPLGFEVEQGDWSLLDPVRAGPKIYRDAP
jgi:hypothetical protein